MVTSSNFSAEILSVLETRFEVETLASLPSPSALSLGLELVPDTFEGISSTTVDAEAVFTLVGGVDVVIEVVSGSLEHAFKGSSVTIGTSVVRRLLNTAGVVVVFSPDCKVAVDISNCSSIVVTVAVWGLETKDFTVTGTEEGLVAWTVAVAAVVELIISTLSSSSVLKSS